MKDNAVDLLITLAIILKQLFSSGSVNIVDFVSGIIRQYYSLRVRRIILKCYSFVRASLFVNYQFPIVWF